MGDYASGPTLALRSVTEELVTFAFDDEFWSPPWVTIRREAWIAIGKPMTVELSLFVEELPQRTNPDETAVRIW